MPKAAYVDVTGAALSGLFDMSAVFPAATPPTAPKPLPPAGDWAQAFGFAVQTAADLAREKQRQKLEGQYLAAGKPVPDSIASPGAGSSYAGGSVPVWIPLAMVAGLALFVAGGRQGGRR